MKIRDSIAFVTGANRGIGLAFTQELLAAGARKVYAAARNPERITLDGVSRVRLDVTKPDTIAAAASDCIDVNLLINNAGIALGQASSGLTRWKRLDQKWRPTTLGRSCSVVHSLQSWRRTAAVLSSMFCRY
jgi:NAD(P)-dependent dehydrogenase (short-subunit alcohol dehydrogenase family)